MTSENGEEESENDEEINENDGEESEKDNSNEISNMDTSDDLATSGNHKNSDETIINSTKSKKKSDKNKGIKDSKSTKKTPVKNVILKLSDLLKKIRKIIKMIRKNSLIFSFVHQFLKFLRQSKSESTQEIRNSRALTFLLDFHVRWNSTFLMVVRFLLFRPVVEEITKKPGNIDGLKDCHIEKLSNLVLSKEEWDLLEILKRNLAPFYKASCILSASSYPTLSLSYFVRQMLKNFIESKEP